MIWPRGDTTLLARLATRQRRSAPAPGPLSNPNLNFLFFKLSDGDAPHWGSPCSGESYSRPLGSLSVEGEVDEFLGDWGTPAFDCEGSGGGASFGVVKLTLPGEDAVAAVGSADIETFEGQSSATSTVAFGGGAYAGSWTAWPELCVFGGLQEGGRGDLLSSP